MFTQPLILGSTYRLKFKSSFERHGVCTTPGVTCLHPGGGVFRLEQITNFRDLVQAGIKLYDVFFAPLGFTQEEYTKFFDGKPDDVFVPEYTTKTINNVTVDTETARDENERPIIVRRNVVSQRELHVETGKSLLRKHYNDEINYASYPIYKFVDVVDTDDVLWVPELTIAEFPEIDINEYKDLSLVIRLGYLDHPENIDPMLLAIRERMAIFGWRPRHVKLYTTDSKWMSRDEYDRLKSLRVPADICTIPKAEKKNYLGKLVIENDRFRRLVDKTAVYPIDVNKELDINSVMEQDVTLDNRLFLVDTKADEIYVPGDRYFIEQTIELLGGKSYQQYQLLREGIDYNPGENIHTYALYTGGIEEGTTYYKLVPQYELVPFGHNRDYDIDELKVKNFVVNYTAIVTAGADAVEPQDEVEYYIGISGSEPDSDYRAAKDEDFDYESSVVDGVVQTIRKFKTGLRYYTKGETVISYSDATELLVGNADSVLYHVLPSKYEAITPEELPTFTGDKYVRVIQSASDASGTRVLHEVYSTINAMKLRGFKFTGDDVFGMSKTMTLQLEDIIDISLDRTNTILPNVISDKYRGRMFEYTVPDLSNPNQPKSIEVELNDDSFSKIPVKTGVILGQMGSACKELYIKSDDIKDRNYYMLYLEEKDKCEKYKSQCSIYEEIIKQMNDQIAELKTQQNTEGGN